MVGRTTPPPVLGFYGHGAGRPYREFSNFYWQDRPFEFAIPSFAKRPGYPESVSCHFSEKAIMVTKAALMGDKENFEAIVAAEDPDTCKALGRSVRNFDNELWLEHLDAVAFEVVRQKFASCQDLGKLLLSTGDAIIAEAAPWDTIWGIGLPLDDPRLKNPEQWCGRNALGVALMRARDALRNGEGVDGNSGSTACAVSAAEGGAQRAKEGSLGPTGTCRSAGFASSSAACAADLGVERQDRTRRDPALPAAAPAAPAASKPKAKRWAKRDGALRETPAQAFPGAADDARDTSANGTAAPAFDCFAVLDFEATCDNKPGLFQPQEVIELPIVLVCPRTRSVVGEFRTYVRPVHKPQLTEFCTELTGIQQAQVDDAPTWPEAFAQAQAWLDSQLVAHDFKHCVFVTCGDWDLQTMLVNQCAVSQQSIPDRFREWLNIKNLFRRVTQKRGTGMKMMLEEIGLPLLGRHHSGLDDSKNIASLLLELLRQGATIHATILSRSR